MNLILKNLTIGYPKHPIINNINLNIPAGEIIGIIGRNGCGKSTLLKTIMQIIKPLQGDIFLDNQAVSSFTTKEFAQSFAYLQQEGAGYNITVKDFIMNARYPYKKWWQNPNQEDVAIVNNCLAYMDLEEYQDQLLSQLSGGQKQRVYLAKVLAQTTPFLCLDEPTTGLDLIYQVELFRFCQALLQYNKTVIMVVHEIELAYKYCTKIIILGDNRILDYGNTTEVLTEEALSTAYHHTMNLQAYHDNIILDIPYQESIVKEEYLRNICQSRCRDV